MLHDIFYRILGDSNDNNRKYWKCKLLLRQKKKTGNPKMFRNEISYSDEEKKLVGYEKI